MPDSEPSESGQQFSLLGCELVLGEDAGVTRLPGGFMPRIALDPTILIIFMIMLLAIIMAIKA